jgi:hypothetical protein
VTGALKQKAGKAGCISDEGRGRCAEGRAIEGVVAIDISPDGRTVYVAAEDPSSVAIFDRNPRSGVLRQKAGKAGCFSGQRAERTCTRSRALLVLSSVTVSTDGKSVYALSYSGHGPGGKSSYQGTLVAFERNPDSGALTQPPGPLPATRGPEPVGSAPRTQRSRPRSKRSSAPTADSST